MSTDLSLDPVFFDEADPQPTPVVIEPIAPPGGITLTAEQVAWCLRLLELLHIKDMPHMAVTDIAYHVEHVLQPKAFERLKRCGDQPCF